MRWKIKLQKKRNPFTYLNVSFDYPWVLRAQFILYVASHEVSLDDQTGGYKYYINF